MKVYNKIIYPRDVLCITILPTNKLAEGILKPTVCPRSSDPFYIKSYNIKRVTTSWTYSNYHGPRSGDPILYCKLIYKFGHEKFTRLIGHAAMRN